MTQSAHQQESRVKKTILNARINLIFYFLTLCLSFFSRKIFLDCLGADFVGLIGTLQNLLGFLNLAELGIGSAIGYVLYKPLFDHEQTKINEIISVMGYLYRCIGKIILVGGVILACFLPLIFPDNNTGFRMPLIYCAYFAFLASSLIGYFINYRQNLLGADQKNYVVTAYYQSVTIIKNLIQMAMAYYTQNLYIWVAIEFSFGIIYSFILNWKINRTYPWLKADISLGKNVFNKYPEVMKYTKQIFIHKIGGFFQYQVTPFLVYSFSSLNVVALYQNYTIITVKVATAFSNIFGGIGASIGNLIAEGNKEKTLSTFWELMSLKFFVAGLICIPTYILIDSFISVWLGPKYILETTTVVIMLISTFINSVRGLIDDFNNGFGLFWDVWSPIIESILLVVIGILGGILWGFNGVLLGSLSGLVIVISIWKPYLLFRWGFHSSVFIYWREYIKNLFCVLISLIITLLTKNIITIDPEKNFLYWALYAVIIITIYTFISYLAFLLLTTGMKTFNYRVISFIKNRIK